MRRDLMMAVAMAGLFAFGSANAQTSTESGGGSTSGGNSTVIQQQPSAAGTGSDNSAKQYAPGQQEGAPKESAPGQQTEGTAQENAPGQVKKNQSTDETATSKKQKSSDSSTESDQTGGTMKKKTSSETTREGQTGSKSTDSKNSSDTSSDTSGATGATEKAGKIDIPSNKRAEVRKSFTSKQVKRVDLDIDVNVGVRVPSDRVVLYDVPPTIIRIVPAFSHYKYFVLADGTIVIVDPSSFVVVYVMTA